MPGHQRASNDRELQQTFERRERLHLETGRSRRVSVERCGVVVPDRVLRRGKPVSRGEGLRSPLVGCGLHAGVRREAAQARYPHVASLPSVKRKGADWAGALSLARVSLRLEVPVTISVIPACAA
eukprot:753311-Hanusia_phi.AAC.2